MGRPYPTVHINGTTYVVDEQRRQLRNTADPREVIAFRERWQDIEPGIDVLGDNYISAA